MVTGVAIVGAGEAREESTRKFFGNYRGQIPNVSFAIGGRVWT